MPANPPHANNRSPLSRGKKLAFAGILLLLIAPLGVECLLRAYVLARFGNLHVYDNNNFLYQPNERWHYQPKPNLDYFPDGRHVVTNSLGFRSPEPGTKTTGRVRVAFTGGSTTFDTLASDNSATTAMQLAAQAEAAGLGPVEIINAGCNGYDSWHSRIVLEERILPLQPDILVIHDGLNDIAPRFRSDFKPDYSHVRTPLRYHPDNLLYNHSLTYRLVVNKLLGDQNAFQLLKAEASTDVLRENLRRNSLETYHGNLRHMIGVARANQIQPVLATVAFCTKLAKPDAQKQQVIETMYIPEIRAVNDCIRSLATETKTPLADYAAGMPDDPSLYGDYTHCNDAGLHRHAEILLQTLQNEGLLKK